MNPHRRMNLPRPAFRHGSACLLLAALFLAAPVSAAFRDSFWGARSLALGGAFTGVTDDPESIFYNPASLAVPDRSDFRFSGGASGHQKGRPSRALASLSYVDGGVSAARAGFGWSHSLTKGVEREDVFAFSLARAVTDRLAAGMNLKLLNRSLERAPFGDRSALGVDAGLTFSPTDRWTWGLAARDLNAPRVGVSRAESLPVKPALGTSFRAGRGALLLLELNRDPSRVWKARGGIERLFLDGKLGLRMGVGGNGTAYGLSLPSVAVGGVRARLDYAYFQPSQPDREDRVHLLTMAFRFGGSGGAPTPAAMFHPPVRSTATAKDDLKDAILLRMAPQRPPVPLGPLDVIQINVKNHPELDALVTVDAWGVVHLSFIGGMNVNGLTPDELEKMLQRIYAGFFTEAPSVDVVVKDSNSRAVYVTGAVERPGKYPLKDTPMTLRDVIYLAGQPTERAAAWRVFVTRQTPKGTRTIPVNFEKIYYRGKTENNIELQSGDIVYVPMTLLDTVATYIGRIIGPIIGVARNAGLTGAP